MGPADSIRDRRRTPTVPAMWLSLAAEVVREDATPAEREGSARLLAARVLAYGGPPLPEPEEHHARS